MDVALPLIEDGVVEGWGLSPPELAICCGSHGGEAAHIRCVRGMATAYGRLAQTAASGDGAAGAVVRAMGRHPFMVALVSVLTQLGFLMDHEMIGLKEWRERVVPNTLGEAAAVLRSLGRLEEVE